MATGYTDEGLYYRQIMDNPKNRIYIKGVSGTISGFIDSEMAFTATADYSEEDLISGAAGMIDAGAKFGNKIMGGTKRVKPQSATRQTWQDSSFAPINIDIYVPTVSGSDNVMKQSDDLWKFLLPTQEGSFVRVPNNYSATGSGGPKNLVTNALSIQIGKMFYAYNAFIMSNGTLTISKERVVSNGVDHPLYIKITCMLTPAYQFRADDVIGFFKAVGGGLR